jgi:hypothetical protein
MSFVNISMSCFTTLIMLNLRRSNKVTQSVSILLEMEKEKQKNEGKLYFHPEPISFYLGN